MLAADRLQNEVEGLAPGGEIVSLVVDNLVGAE
jgi:hypothetical protein